MGLSPHVSIVRVDMGMNESRAKVPVWATVWSAYKFYGENIGQLALFFLQLGVAWFIPISLISAAFPFAVSNVLVAIWGTVSVGPLAVLIHRAILTRVRAPHNLQNAVRHALSDRRHRPGFGLLAHAGWVAVGTSGSGVHR